MSISRDKEDDDDDFFPNPKYKSNLASIFNISADDGNASLTYTAPKQPKASSKAGHSSKEPSNRLSSTVLIAKTVQTFKMVDSAYQSQGKLGAAIVCMDKEASYQLILYRNKGNHVCITRIHKEFKFHIQPKNYASFYDNHNGIWSILFDSTADLVDFTLQVALARWRTGDSSTPLIVQDLCCPASESSDCKADVGDSVELSYTIRAIEMATEDTEESLKVCVTAEQTGWKQSLVGTKPTSQRVIILQPFMLGDLNPEEIVYNCPVVVKFTVDKIKKQALQRPETSTIPATEPSTSSHPSSSATAEPSGSPKATKADLITRMARMGQALPFKTVTPTVSDSDEIEENLSGRLRKSVPKPRTRTHHSSAATINTPNLQTEMTGAVGPIMGVAPTLPSPVTIMPHQIAMGQPYMLGSVYPTSQVDNQAQLNMFFSEVRTTNSELRMGITRLTDKVEALHSKLESPDKNQPSHEMMSVMERLLQHEQQLKDQLQIVINSFQNAQHPSAAGVSGASSGSYLTTSPATSDASVVESCKTCIQHKESQTLIFERIKKLEEENEFLQTTTSAQKEALQNARIADQDRLLLIEDIRRQLSEKEVLISGLREKLENIEAEKNSLAEEVERKKHSLADLQNTILEKQSFIDKLEQAVSDSEAKNVEEVRNNLKEVLDQKMIVEEHAKKLFNTVFRLVKAQLQPQNSYEGSAVLSVLGSTIKAVTLEYLQNGDFSIPSWQQKSDSTKILSEPLQNDSASNQIMSEGQYVRKEQRSPMPVETKLSAAICNTSAPETATHQDTSLQSASKENLENEKENAALLDTSTPHKVVSVIADNTERFHPEDSLTSVVFVDESVQVKPEASASLHNTDGGYDEWKPQPPPPPLFEDEQHGDTWLNS